MSANLPSDPCVALVAADESGISALRPARETLDAFAVAWKEMLLPAGAGSLGGGGLRAVIVASTDATLPSTLSVETRLPVIRVPVPTGEYKAISLLLDPETANLPAGNGAFATVAIGEAGAKNAALLVVSMLGLNDERLWAEWLAFRQRQTDAVLGSAPLADP